MKEQVTELWNWLSIRDKPAHADLIFIFGGDSMMLPQKALELYRAGYSRKLIASGSTGTFGNRDWNKPEADLFAEFLIKNGVPDSDILIENSSNNTQENVINGLKLLESRKLPHHSVILVSSPVHQRRAQATYLMNDRGAKIINAHYEEPIPNFITGQHLRSIAERCVQEYERLNIYATKGDLTEQKVPAKIRVAYEKLHSALESSTAFSSSN